VVVSHGLCACVSERILVIVGTIGGEGFGSNSFGNGEYFGDRRELSAMTEATPKYISVIARESEETGARSSKDIGGRIGKNSELVPVQVEVIETSKPVEVAKLKREMSLFLQAMQEVLNEADSPNDKLPEKWV